MLRGNLRVGIYADSDKETLSVFVFFESIGECVEFEREYFGVFTGMREVIMVIEDLIKALEILSKYDKKGPLVGAEHDILYAYVSPEDVSDLDREKLSELGFEASHEAFYFLI